MMMYDTIRIDNMLLMGSRNYAMNPHQSICFFLFSCFPGKDKYFVADYLERMLCCPFLYFALFLTSREISRR